MRGLSVILTLMLLGVHLGYPLVAGEFLRPDSAHSITPRQALFYSALCPGLGQVYVRQPFKAALVVAAEGYHLYQFSRYQRLYGYITKTQDKIGRDVWASLSEVQKKDSVAAYTGKHLTDNTWRVREKRNKYAWWCVAFYLIGILDAYVDAHLYYFPNDKVELSYRPDSIMDEKISWRWTITWRM